MSCRNCEHGGHPDFCSFTCQLTSEQDQPLAPSSDLSPRERWAFAQQTVRSMSKADIDTMLATANEGEFSEDDWMALAVFALDQAGIDVSRVKL